MGGRLIVGKIEIDENAKTRAAYNVKSVPTLIVFKDGVERARMTGATSKTRLTAFIAGAD
jgi:thioredoxin 1